MTERDKGTESGAEPGTGLVQKETIGSGFFPCLIVNISVQCQEPLVPSLVPVPV